MTTRLFKNIFLILVFSSEFYLTDIVFASEHDSKSTNEINVKFINESDHAIRLKIGEEEIVFGLISRPVIYSAIPANEEVKFEIEAIRDNESIEISDVSKVANTGTSIFSVSKNVADAAMKAQDLADEAAILQKELLLRAKYLKEIDGSPFREFAANIQVTEQASTMSQAAKTSMGLGVAGIGISGVDWLCSEGHTKLSLLLKINEIDDFEEGKELLVRITNNQIFYELRDPPESRNSLKCIVSSDSSRDIMCSYKDAEGDIIKVKLDKNRFRSGEVDVAENEAHVILYEVIRHKNSCLHHSFVVTRGLCGAAVALVDPFPFTKVLSAAGAVGDLGAGVFGFVQRFHPFYKKMALKKQKEVKEINVYDENMVKIGVKNVK